LIEERDRADSLPVVVVTQDFARQAWPGDANPIGRRVRRGSWEQIGFPWLTVVGVIADTKEDQFNFRIDRPAWYLPYSQVDTATPIKIALRVNGDPKAIAGTVREAARDVDSSQPLTAVRPLSEQAEAVTARDRFSAVLVGWLAFIGVVFATCGLYSVVAYTVSRRRGEFGLRLALGASPRDIRALVLTRGGWLVAAGVILGLLMARGASRVLSSTLYEVRPGDPWTFAGVAIFLAIVSLLACYLPARRASGVDPAIALRD
jgi:predicted lysophospholipase L1 biosynthesis ABC-type transport system permease subunit